MAKTSLKRQGQVRKGARTGKPEFGTRTISSRSNVMRGVKTYCHLGARAEGVGVKKYGNFG